MKRFIIILVQLLSIAAVAQHNTIKGDVLDEKGSGLGYATVALMNPADSTLAFFGITNVEGHFEIKSTKPGNYLMQIAYLGYSTLYRQVKLPLEKDDNFGAIIMKPVSINLGEVQVKGEYIPIMMKKDTIEYNAAAFKTKPDAVAEDLLRKLPGVEVDRAGNIKAVGEDVKKVLVDGKEFFGNDPKVATKNLPADAVKKVQVYDKKSDESEFTGINDGTHDKTMNLVLKDEKKKGIFGDVTAGGGSGEHFLGGAKIYRFSKKNQFALLGMVNNINQFGFSFSDYLNFSGGLSILGGGGGGKITFGGDNSLPVNFGQPVNGLVTSGAAGLNFSHEFRKDNRLFMSYIGNASRRNTTQSITTQNFTPGSSFTQQQESTNVDENWTHRVNFGWRNRIDSSQNISFSGNASLTNGKGSGQSATGSFRSDSLLNTLSSMNNDKSDRLSGDINGSYIKKLNLSRTILKFSGDASYSYGLSKIQWQNITEYFNPGYISETKQYQKNLTDVFQCSLGIRVSQKLGKLLYLEPGIYGSYLLENLNRKQGIPAETEQVIDSLSPVFARQYLSLRPVLRLKRNTEKTQFAFTAQAEFYRLANSLVHESDVKGDYIFFTPSISYEYEYKKGQRIRVFYASSVNTPTANQLLPVVNNINPLSLYYGNRDLKPEYSHDLYFNWWLFDSFSFTSVFANLNAGYVQDKINWSRTINDSLGQTLTLVNVPSDYNISGSIDFSTPIRKLGLTIHASLRESWNRGISLVNSVENINTNLSHKLTLSFDNRKKDKWDINFGASFSLTDARYSVQESLNNRYFDLAYFAEVRFTPSDHWSFAATADVINYNARTFNDAVSIPLIGAEVNFYFLKNNRGLFTLSAFDLLNKNTGIDRISEMNYLRETRSNTIGRYVMLSFKYRLNKFNDKSTGIDIKVNNR